jgi:hypothetical protein
VKISFNAKVGGLQYRPEIKITGCGINLVEDYNEITDHMLECVKTEIKSVE